jgi:hypothetical protein
MNDCAGKCQQQIIANFRFQQGLKQEWLCWQSPAVNYCWFWALAEFWFLFLFKMPWSDRDKNSNWINVLNEQEVSLEGAWDIHLECHLKHRPFLISRTVLLEMSKGWNFTGESSSTVASSLDSSLHPPFIIITQVMQCKQVFYVIGNYVGYISCIKSGALWTMNCSWCLWTISFVRDCTIGHTAWGITSQFYIFVSHCSSALFHVILLMVLAI